MITLRALWSRARTTRARFVALFSIALLPVGVVAVMQTMNVVTEAHRLDEDDVFDQAMQAVASERALLNHALGATEVLVTAAGSFGLAGPECEAFTTRFVEESGRYIFAGIIPLDGMMTCSSAGRDVDFGGTEGWESFVRNARTVITVNPDGAATRQPVVVLSRPLFDDQGGLIGAVALSFPRELTDEIYDTPEEGIALALVDAEGQVLMTRAGQREAALFEEVGIAPGDEAIPGTGQTFSYLRADGTSGQAAIAPLLPGTVYVLGIYEKALIEGSVPVIGSTATIFPILMWLIGLGVAILAVDRLVLSDLKRMERRMSRFVPEDPSSGKVSLNGATTELRSIARSYNELIARVVKDRESLQATVREKEILLREVHHRVKNNLQLIASILNIQMRTIEPGPAKDVLRSVQRRVVSLSSIHKALYTGSEVTEVRVDRLLSEVVQAALAVGASPKDGLTSEVRLDRLSMDPDLAVPLSLLTTELVTNAVKYVGKDAGGRAFIDVRMEARPDVCELEVANSIGTPLHRQDASVGTGLGQRLIEAFALQLDAEIETESTETRHLVRVRFHPLGPHRGEEDEGADDETGTEDAAPERELSEA